MGSAGPNTDYRICYKPLSAFFSAGKVRAPARPHCIPSLQGYLNRSLKRDPARPLREQAERGLTREVCVGQRADSLGS